MALIFGENVLKHGMSTGVTIGKIKRFVDDQLVFEIVNVDKTPFSSPGDSGSLVYLVHGHELIAFALQYQADETGDMHYAIPLWRVFFDFADKQDTDQFFIKFDSPLLKRFKFDRNTWKNHSVTNIDHVQLPVIPSQEVLVFQLAGSVSQSNQFHFPLKKYLLICWYKITDPLKLRKYGCRK